MTGVPKPHCSPAILTLPRCPHTAAHVQGALLQTWWL